MSNKIRVGIIFGGQSREREISFRGGRTAYNHIDKRFFEPVPIFVDSLGNFILVNPELLFEESIRDFYPSKNLNRNFRLYIEHLGPLSETQLYKLIYKIGKQIKLEDLKQYIDFAFIVMHGPHAEDGSVQGLLEWLGVPYMGPGIMGSAIGVDKPIQNQIMALATGQKKKMTTISYEEWHTVERSKLFTDLINTIGFPFVIKAPHQGSSIGVAIVRKRSMEEFTRSMSQCFFETTMTKREWDNYTNRQKKHFADKMASLDEGVGLPVTIRGKIIYHPADLIEELDALLFSFNEVLITSVNSEDVVLIEEFTVGQEFSCGVIQDDNDNTITLPPTEITAEQQTFDFKAKYQTNSTKKRIPVETSTENLDKIEDAVKKAFKACNLGVVSRIDGFLTPDSRVLLHDPNTLPGMSPTSLIFKQMAEIGLNVTNSLTYLIRQSIRERIRSGKNTFEYRSLLQKIDELIEEGHQNPKQKVAILFGESDEEYLLAQQKYAEFSSSANFEPIPVCAASNGALFKIPVNLMNKADILEFGVTVGQRKHPYILRKIEETKHIVEKYAGDADLHVSRITETQLVEMVKFIYQVETEQLIEL